MAKTKYIDLDEALSNRLITYYTKVILDRQIPDIRDGLKTAQRRILYVMNRDGNLSTRAFTKSRRITGNVASIHPHGDTYDVMANMISPYAIMQPLVKGHGGFHNIMGKASSADRYTEARLQPFTEKYLLKNLAKKIAPFKPDFDQKGFEPEVLPARLPLLLVNGVSGIGAGGISSYFPPHNYETVKNYMIDLIDHPEKSGKDLIKDNRFYPDFPSGGIMDTTGLVEAYESGSGNFQVYAKIELDTESKSKHDIIRVLELPYGTTLEKDIIEPLAALTQGKTNPKIKTVNKDLKEEFSVIKDVENRSREGKYIDFSILVAKGTDLKALVAKLTKRLRGFRNTIIINMNFVNGSKLVQYTSLKDVATDWLEFRRSVVLNEKMIELREIEKRKSIIEATNLVIGDDANREFFLKLANSAKNRADLGAKILDHWSHLNEIQVEFLTNIRIYNISKDDLAGFTQEMAELTTRADEVIKYFKDKKEIDRLIKEELQEIADSGLLEERIYHTTYQTGIGTETPKDEIPEENFLLIASSDNFIKKVKSDPSTAQKRSGKGRSIGKLKEGAYPKDIVEVSSKGTVLFMTKEGNVFKTDVMDIPTSSSLNTLGTSYTRFLRGQTLTNIIPIEEGMLDNSDLAFLIVTKQNKIKLTSVDQFSAITKAGLRMSVLADEDDEVISATLVNLTEDFRVLCFSTDGRALTLKGSNLPLLGRVAAGSKVFATRKGQAEPTVVAACPYVEGKADTAIIVTSQGRGKLVNLDQFPVANRNTVGLMSAKLKEGDTVAYGGVISKDTIPATNLMLVTTKKSITIGLTNMKYMERPALGLTLKKNEEDEVVLTAALLSAD